MKPAFFFFFTALLAGTLAAHADLRPARFGPFLQQAVELQVSPAGSGYLPPNGSYNLQVGWMEPINILPREIFRGTYLEAQGNATLSPYESQVGMLFNLRPIRFLEGGLGYNRLLFPYTLLGFSRPASDTLGNWLPAPAQWRASEIWSSRVHEGVGADVFTFQVNLTANVGPVQLHGGAFRSLWDVDVNRDVVLDYNSGLLIQKRDRINSVYAQAVLNSMPSFGGGFSARGLTLRDQYWWVTHTGLSQHLLSAGITGLHHGRNDDRLYHGLDLFAGYWLDHPQFAGQAAALKRVQLGLRWIWNAQILRLGEN